MLTGNRWLFWVRHSTRMQRGGNAAGSENIWCVRKSCRGCVLTCNTLVM